MPSPFVLDASVLVEFLVPGRWGRSADRFVGALAWPTPIELFAPDLIFLEVGNALRKLALRKALSDRRAGRLVPRVPELAIATVSSTALLSPAWSLRRHMTMYDASYAALARSLDCPLVTTDRRLVSACAKAGVRAYHADEPELGRLLDALESAGR